MMTQKQYDNIVDVAKTGEVVVVKHSRYVLCPRCLEEVLSYHGESDRSDCPRCFSIHWKEVESQWGVQI